MTIPVISPSILNCNIARLEDELTKISSADIAHVDVMDNHFVPNLTWGLPVVEADRLHHGIIERLHASRRVR